MKKPLIITSILVTYAALLVLFLWISRTLKTYSAQQDEISVKSTITNSTEKIKERIHHHSAKPDMEAAVNSMDTAWILKDISQIINEQGVEQVSLMNSNGKVFCSKSRKGNDLGFLVEQDADRIIKQLYFENVLAFHKIYNDSVYRVVVSRIKGNDSIQPLHNSFLVSVDALCESFPNSYTILLGKDTIGENSDKHTISLPLSDPESQVFGHLRISSSSEFQCMFSKIHTWYMVVMYLAIGIMVLISVQYCRLRTKSGQQPSEIAPTGERITSSDSQADAISNFYQGAIDQNFAGIVMFDPLGKITYANKSFETASGYSRKELTERQPTLFTDTDGSVLFNYEFWRRLSNGIAWKGIINCLRHDNSNLALRSTFSPIKTNGFVTGYTALFEDMTTESSSQKDLTELNRKYSTIVENCSDAIWIYNWKTRKFLFVNPAVKRLTGFEPEQILGRSLEEMLEPASYPKVSGMFYKFISQESLSMQTSMAVGCKVRCADGSFHDVEMKINPLVYNSSERPSEILAITRDTSETQKILRKLTVSENTYRMIVENSADMIWKVDADTMKFSYISPAARRVLGYSPEELLRTESFRVLTGQSAQRVRERALMLADQSAVNHKYTCTIICKDGTQRDLENVVTLITDSTGRKEFVGITHDITEANRYERKLKDTLQQMDILLETMPCKIFMKDQYGQYILCNNKLAESVGLSRDKVIGYTAEEIPLPKGAEIMVQQDEEILKTGISYLNQELFIKSKQDQGKWYSVSQVPYIVDNKVIGIIGIMVDISSQKRYEQILQETNKQFENTIENFIDAYLKVKFDGTIIMANPAAAEIIGVESRSTLIGRKINDYVSTDLGPGLNSQFHTELKRMNNISYKLRNTKGETLFCEASLTTFNDKEGKPAGFECLVRNVTERRLHEIQLNALTQNLQNSLEQTRIQKNMIESAHRGITESLNYAKRIQDALLKTSFDTINSKLPDNFIMYQPREIVGGDFIYVADTHLGIVCAVGDCTGHGIPGALMSVLAISLLNDIIASAKPETTPGDVLEELRKRIIATLSNSLILRDGLDICMMFRPKDSSKLVYSGANTPLIICRDGEATMLKPTRCPIGLYPVQSKFENQEFSLKQGDIVYLSSDGYPDQFGITENRKYSQKDFMELLSKISPLTMAQQKSALENTLSEWRGSRKQTDDITVFGIKFMA